MELKYSIATTFLLCLLLVTPYNISRVGSDAADSEVYGIDYRGPETHSSLVTLVTGLRIHQDTVKTSHKPQGSRGDDRGEQVRPCIYITKVQINHLNDALVFIPNDYTMLAHVKRILEGNTRTLDWEKRIVEDGKMVFIKKNLLADCCSAVGNENGVRFWTDFWIGNTTSGIDSTSPSTVAEIYSGRLLLHRSRLIP
uniref:Uncharacterized protein n=1 Tax=Salix viminalis TaxID=40686 RepID=A0A6N2L9P9_SALVM